MTAPLPPQALHIAFDDGPFRLAMGLVPCPAAAWIELDDRYPAEMEERRALLASRHAEVFGAVPGSEAARAETLALLAEHLSAHHAAHFAREGRMLRNALTGEAWNLADPPRDPLEAAGLLVQEDLCLIRPDPAGPVLEAAVLCFPSRWRLQEKLGRPLAAVHGPVPFYAERLAAPVDRFMGALRAGRVAMRMNWSLADDAALFQPGPSAPTDPPITPEQAGTRLFYRMERQTFRRLEASGRVLFTIRVHVHPLARLAPQAARLAAAIRALPEATKAYKGIPRYEAALLAHLDAAAG